MNAQLKTNGRNGATGNGGPDAIQVEHIVKKYGDFTAVDDVSFSVKQGEIFGLLGPNGAGKSTLIRMMTTLLPITSGVARIAGVDVSQDPNAARRYIGVIPQAMTSDLDLTVYENMVIHAKLYQVPAADRERNIDELLEMVDLSKWKASMAKNLSGGMRRRLEIARGLVHSPKIFFLDEPTTGLDPVSRVAVWQMLTNIKQHRDLTVLITTHYMDEADRLCHRIAIVDHGKLVALDAPEALKQTIPGANVIEVQFSGTPEGWEQKLAAFPDVRKVTAEADHAYRIISDNSSKTITEMVEMALKAGIEVKALSVHNTTLDDVFVHYTGRQLRDQEVSAHAYTGWISGTKPQ